MHRIFYNYEETKLFIAHPDITNIFILFLLVSFSLLFIRRDEAASAFLDRVQTNQLKGIAIFLVIPGHLWIHVSEDIPPIIFSGDAVALFLLLSGYGLTVSVRKEFPTAQYFFMQRLKRVMMPYWIVTVFLILLDYIILNRTYFFGDIMLTLLGININLATKYIDYVRWYITLQLLWYCLFYLTNFKTKGAVSLKSLFICAVLIFFIDYYITHFGWYQIFAFPVGCAIGAYYDKIRSSMFKHLNRYTLFALIIIIYSIAYKLYIKDFLELMIPYIALSLMNECSSILLCGALIIPIAALGLKSRYLSVLSFCGIISYELFLLHGAFLIKYNPVITRTSYIPISISFIVFLTAITIVSYYAHRIIGRCLKLIPINR